jgi:hypothetical protein
MSPLCPISNAATIAPYAVDLGHGRAAGRDCHLDPPFGRDNLGVEATDVVEQLVGQPFALDLHLTGGSNAPQQVSGPNGRQPASKPAWDQRAQQRMQTTHRLGAQGCEVVMAVDQQPQPRAVILTLDWAQVGCGAARRSRPTKRRWVALARFARAQQPHPSRQRGGHVDDGLAGVDQLLGQQITEPSCSLDRPCARLERCGPGQQPLGLATVRAYPELRRVCVRLDPPLRLCATLYEGRRRS